MGRIVCGLLVIASFIVSPAWARPCRPTEVTVSVLRLALLLLLLGCYEHHRVEARIDSGRDASMDAGPEVLPCESLRASRPRFFTRAPPTDATLGSIDTTPAGVVIAAFTSSNDVREMDVARWIMALDPTTGAPLFDDRAVVFGAPSGLTFASHSHVLYPSGRSGFAYTWSAGQGCLVRRLGDRGELDGDAMQISRDACLGARSAPDGRVFMAFRTEGDPLLRASIAELDERFRERRRVGESQVVGDAFHWTWTIDGDDLRVAYVTRDLELYEGVWRDAEPVARRVEGSTTATLPRYVRRGDDLVLAWREGAAEEMRAAFARVEDLEVRITGLGLHVRTGWDVEPRGDELWVAFAPRGEHRAARVAVARLGEDFEPFQVLRFGEERFPTRIRMETTPAGAFIAYAGQRDDGPGFTQIYAAPIRCVDGVR